ncbi:hypothetical protein DFQ28_002587 [Apophysomyces sp. BC1034]|nr:hypothetical protein DFQ30_002907 [Apophysomyces sp. BC1015]KAG0179456.1 hypothetical protein DFQ29_002075 [Apophysomyces sp. BC1021]KAG0190040.1 hypothetical protein DFQ28_002587 [Apophysomyces sp. BC1034]
MPALIMPKPRYALRAALLRERPEKTLIDDEEVSGNMPTNQCISGRVTGSDDSNRQYESAPQSPLVPVHNIMPNVSELPLQEDLTDPKTSSSSRPSQLTASPTEVITVVSSSAQQKQDHVTRSSPRYRTTDLSMDLEALRHQVNLIQQQQEAERLDRQRMEQERRNHEKTIIDQIQRMEKVLQASQLLTTNCSDQKGKQPRRQRSRSRRPTKTADEDHDREPFQPHIGISRRSSQSSRYHPSDDDDSDDNDDDMSPQLSRNSSTGSRASSIRRRQRSRSIESHSTWPPPPTTSTTTLPYPGETRPRQTKSFGRPQRSQSLPRSPQPEYHSAVEEEGYQQSPRRRRHHARRHIPQPPPPPGFMYGYQFLGGDPYFSHGPHPVSYADESQPWAGLPPSALAAAAALGWPPPPNPHGMYNIPSHFPHPFSSRENHPKEQQQQANSNQEGKGSYRRSRAARQSQSQQPPPQVQAYHSVYATDGPPMGFI